MPAHFPYLTFVQYLSSKQIAPTDNVWPKSDNNAKVCHRVRIAKCFPKTFEAFTLKNLPKDAGVNQTCEQILGSYMMYALTFKIEVRNI